VEEGVAEEGVAEEAVEVVEVEAEEAVALEALEGAAEGAFAPALTSEAAGAVLLVKESRGDAETYYEMPLILEAVVAGAERCAPSNEPTRKNPMLPALLAEAQLQQC